MKDMLILKASTDVLDAEVINIASQTVMYNINAEIINVTNYKSLFDALNQGKTYDYIYLATHGCETHWGNISGTLQIGWIPFAALICSSGVVKPGAIFLHSCCRGGLSQVAWQMFACCPKIEFVCGPRHNVMPVDLITIFNLFLYNIEVKRIDPVRAAEKVLSATDIRMVSYDRVESCSEMTYLNYKFEIQEQINIAFGSIGYNNEINRIVWEETKDLGLGANLVIPENETEISPDAKSSILKDPASSN